MELSILLTMSKYFTDPKFVFTLDLISSSVESSITNKKTLLLSCFLAAILCDFLELSDVIHPLQFDFRKKHSTAHALTSLTEKIKRQLMMVIMGVEFSLT